MSKAFIFAYPVPIRDWQRAAEALRHHRARVQLINYLCEDEREVVADL
jgi:hypothetical protein